MSPLNQRSLRQERLEALEDRFDALYLARVHPVHVPLRPEFDPPPELPLPAQRDRPARKRQAPRKRPPLPPAWSQVRDRKIMAHGLVEDAREVPYYPVERWIPMTYCPRCREPLLLCNRCGNYHHEPTGRRCSLVPSVVDPD